MEQKNNILLQNDSYKKLDVFSDISFDTFKELSLLWYFLYN